MEIERKWMVKGWPEKTLADTGESAAQSETVSAASAAQSEEAGQFPLLREQMMRQGYISIRPTVRIREEAETGGPTDYILCFKSPANRSGLSRQEIEFSITPDQFAQLEDLIGIPLIPKLRRTYLLPDGLHLEVSLVDEGKPTEFMYAEVEFATEDQARNWDPAAAGLGAYLDREVTGEPGQSMGAFWELTRLRRS